MTLDLPDDSPVLDMPWIITFGPLDDDDEWEPVVCGPYERPHALALAESVVGDEDLMAVVEPLLPHVSVDQIRGEIAAARLAAASEDSAGEDSAGEAELAAELDGDDGFGAEHDDGDSEPAEPAEPPSIDEVRAGFARIAARLTAAGG